MQDYSYLTTGGVLNFDPNAYLNAPTVEKNPYAQIGMLPTGTTLQEQPKQDGFFSKNKDTIKKVAAGALLLGLVGVGIAKGSNMFKTISNKFSGASTTATNTIQNGVVAGKSFLGKCTDAIKNFFTK